MVTTKPRTVTHNPHILGGEPILSGTRIPVRAVVGMARAYRHELSAVQHALPTLTIADIELALRYAQEHADEIARWIRYDADADNEPL
jgi:uncharacterized protein (DUF433 family)